MDESDIERTPEYNDFMAKLEQFHAARGTPLLREPGLGPRKISLLKLYKLVTGRGGYDAVTEEKGTWKSLAGTYKLPPTITNAGFLLKTIYYRYLAAYEIELFHGKKAPPPEHLEHLSAKGGAIMTRTAEQLQALMTPKEEPKKGTSPSPTPMTRRLRDQPTPKQHYEGETGSNGRTSQTPAASATPMPLPAVAHTPYMGQTPVPPAMTPFGAPGYPPRGPAGAAVPSVLIPPPVMASPNLMRITMALRSGIPSEVDWAMHHLLRMSYEQGEHLRLELLPGLPEALLEKLSLIMELPVDGPDAEIKAMQFTAEEQKTLDKVLEAGLVLRNLALEADNGKFLARLLRTRESVQHGIGLPEASHLVELKHYCLDIAEAISPHIRVEDENDAFYIGFCKLLETNDRSFLIIALRTLVRLAIGDDTNILLQEIPEKTINRLLQMLILNDEELNAAILDFMYQWTSYKINAQAMMTRPDAIELVKRLVDMMRRNTEEMEYVYPVLMRGEPRHKAPVQPPRLPAELMTELMQYNEPERTIKWLHSAFEEDPLENVTQIMLWNTYQQLFTPFIPIGKPILQAADLIKTVSESAFPKAPAKVLATEEGPKFIIEGIKPRVTPVGVKGKRYFDCKWGVDAATGYGCGMICPTVNELYAHIVDAHLDKTPGATMACDWNLCRQLHAKPRDMKTVALHVRTHMPDSEQTENYHGLRSQLIINEGKPKKDGLGVTATLVLRNLARAKGAANVMVGVEKEIMEAIAVNKGLFAYAGDLLPR
ncbi:hypothetical protein SAICODRAFT_55704 [Saitoella complicata NRRL Y-17804]|nr:uncharacterized protein SAICODRAFT_55704 [Saitoella complicata NRRL Y-17804]ODQ53812.1 hypothetical protein SAICODRAFT_55704 [Saitoella complicata NRRL Y-17804]